MYKLTEEEKTAIRISLVGSIGENLECIFRAELNDDDRDYINEIRKTVDIQKSAYCKLMETKLSYDELMDHQLQDVKKRVKGAK